MTMMWVTVLLVVATMTGCAGARTVSERQGAVVPVTDLGAVAGTWEGLAARDSSDREDWLRLSINPDGTFEGYSARQIGVFAGKGTLAVRDGKVAAVGPHGKAVLTLYERNGPLLLMRFTDTDGVTYSGQLRRTAQTGSR